MANVKAAAYHEVPGDMVQGDIILQIEGLIPSHDGTFTLRGVKLTEIDYGVVSTMLRENGIEDYDVDVLVDEFAALVFNRQIAKALARRTKRVG